MFKHKGKGRTFIHNLQLASLLSTVAGIVNVTGVLALHTFVTNVTGHFSLFSEQMFLQQYSNAVVYLLYILFFLLGSFCSSLMVEMMNKFHHKYAYILPLFTEIILLSIVVFWSFVSSQMYLQYPHIVAFLLLFAMGLQNSLVTRVSQSVVRTTHLTGLFTDLGIDLSKMFFSYVNKKILKKNILLKLMIITGFFVGVLIGGFGYQLFSLKVLLLPVAILLFSLWYDRLLYRYHQFKRQHPHAVKNEAAFK